MMGQSSSVLNQDQTMEKFQQKTFNIMDAGSKLWRGLEGTKKKGHNSSVETVPATVLIPIEDHIKLIEQSAVFLRKA